MENIADIVWAMTQENESHDAVLEVLGLDWTIPNREVMEWIITHGDKILEAPADVIEQDGKESAAIDFLVTVADYADKFGFIVDDPEEYGMTANLDELGRAAENISKEVRKLMKEIEE